MVLTAEFTVVYLMHNFKCFKLIIKNKTEQFNKINIWTLDIKVDIFSCTWHVPIQRLFKSGSVAKTFKPHSVIHSLIATAGLVSLTEGTPPYWDL